MNQNVRFANPLKVISKEADNVKEAMSGVGEKVGAVGQAVASGNAEIERSAEGASQGLNAVAKSSGEAKANVDGVAKAEDKASKETSKFKTALAGVKSAFKGIKMPFAEFLSSIKRIAMYRLLRSIIKQITQGFMEAYHAMYRWSQAGNDNNQFAESMDKIATALHYIHASLSALASPIINALAPVIDDLADKFVGLLNIINQVIATINNQSGWTRAIKKQITYGDTLSDTNKKAKELKKTLLGIDEINLLNGQTNSSTTDTDALYDFEWVAFDKDNALHNFFKDWDWGEAIGQLATILAIIEAIKLAWKGANFLAGGLLGAAAAQEFWSAFQDVFNDKMDWWTGVKLLAGVALATLAGASIGKAFGNAIYGAAIGAIIGGAAMAVASIIDIVKNGLSWINAIGTVLGSVFVGVGLAIVTGTSIIMGGIYGLVVGVVALIVATVIDKWTYLVDYWKSIITGFSQLSMSLGNFVISIIEWVANAMVTYLFNPFLKFVNFLSHTNYSIGEISLPKYKVGTIEEIWNTYLNPQTTGKVYSLYDKVGKDVDWGKVAPYIREAIATGQAPNVRAEDQAEVNKMFELLAKSNEDSTEATSGLTSALGGASTSIDNMMSGLKLGDLSTSLMNYSSSLDGWFNNVDLSSISTDISNLATEASTNFGEDGIIAFDLEALLGKVNDIINNQLNSNNKQGDVYLDGQKVGKVMNKNNAIQRKSLDLYDQVGVLTY